MKGKFLRELVDLGRTSRLNERFEVFRELRLYCSGVAYFGNFTGSGAKKIRNVSSIIHLDLPLSVLSMF